MLETKKSASLYTFGKVFSTPYKIDVFFMSICSFNFSFCRNNQIIQIFLYNILFHNVPSRD